MIGKRLRQRAVKETRSLFEKGVDPQTVVEKLFNDEDIYNVLLEGMSDDDRFYFAYFIIEKADDF